MENEIKLRKRKKIEHWQKIAVCLAVFDAIAVNLSFLFALWVRYDCNKNRIPVELFGVWKNGSLWYGLFCVVVFTIFKLYRSMWRFASYNEFLRVCGASLLTSFCYMVAITHVSHRMPYAYYIMGTVMQAILIISIRFGYRVSLSFRNRKKKEKGQKVRRVLLIGAGNAGQTILEEINSDKHTDKKVCCIIDDNSNKWNRYMDGVPIGGGRDDILAAVKKYRIDDIYVVIPSATPAAKREILNICKETGCEIKNLPGVYQLVSGEVSVSALRKVKIEDLLGREQIKVDMNEIFQYLKGKTILVTGGGGSIGSELSRQIAEHSPRKLVLFDVYENSVYEIEQELRKKYPSLNLVVEIGSIRDMRRMIQLFSEHRPDVVYHAAAHKHVPLMESSPCEAIKNNVIGTYKTAYAAAVYGCSRFVLISTDKAVNPTNIMGASKRLCEMIVQSFDTMIKEGRFNEMPLLYTHEGEECKRNVIPKTEFVAVRFGNVLGSNGSVIPLFRKQIEAGGPVTVTHPDIIRYFMTIPEAVSLVLQAGIYAKGGEIFVLDMGAPVKIDTLARNLIKLSGLKPDEDIKITYTGLRPGEKLYEEKLMAEEGMRRTPNELIQIGQPIAIDTEKFLEQLHDLMDRSYLNEDDIRNTVSRIVLTYQPAGKHGTEKKR